MTYFHPAWLAHLRKYALRDGWRFAPAGTPEAKPPGWLDPSMTRLKEAQEAEARAREAAAQEEFEREVRQLRASHERVKQELAEIKYELAWRRILRKFRPDQPRVPAGNPDGGQWTSGSGSGTSSQSEQVHLDEGIGGPQGARASLRHTRTV